jgi:hypothetical protein
MVSCDVDRTRGWGAGPLERHQRPAAADLLSPSTPTTAEAVFTKAGAFKAAARLHDDGLLSEEPDQALPPSLLLLNQLLGA